MRSLRGRLTLYLLVGSGALLALGGLFLYRVITSRLQEDFDQQLVAKARSLALLTEEAEGALWVELPEEGMPEFAAGSSSEFFEFWMADGKMLRRSNSLAGRDLPRLSAASKSAWQAPRLWSSALPDGRPGRLVQLTVLPRIDDHPAGEGGEAGVEVRFDPAGPKATLVLARGHGDLDRFLAETRLWLGVSFFFLLAGLVGLIRLSLGLGLAPLSRLVSRIERLDAGSLGERIDPTDVPAEISVVVQRINDLLGRLETSFAREKAFSSHLAHELRTPLAELRAATEVALRWPDDSASVAASLEDARAIGLHMERIAENLLALARSESAPEAPVEEEVPLRAAIEEAWRPLARAAAEKKIELNNEIPDGLALPTDRAKLGLILSNLLDNAVAHGSPGGWVACRALPSNHGSNATVALGVEVSNPAADLSSDDLPHLFDRFWQKDPSRSGPHAGLGLPLVASLGRSLGLIVDARLAAGNLEIRLARF
ncbi:MAG: ATP-binding protein [Acidobacteriota bacterium]